MRSMCVWEADAEQMRKQSKQSCDFPVGDQTSKCLSEICLSCSPSLTGGPCDCHNSWSPAGRFCRRCFREVDAHFLSLSWVSVISFFHFCPWACVLFLEVMLMSHVHLCLKPALMSFTCVLLFHLSIEGRVHPFFLVMNAAQIQKLYRGEISEKNYSKVYNGCLKISSSCCWI